MYPHLPRVACLCPTFNRYPNYGHLLEEAVESFLRQDYPSDKRTLFILNDTPGQTLRLADGVVERGNVVVMNKPERYTSLGKKRNDLIELAYLNMQQDIILPWDDDDISLPHRVSQAAHVLGSYTRFWKPAYWNPKRYWYLPPTGLEVPSTLGWGHNCSAMSFRAFRLVGGYQLVSGSEDALIDISLRKMEEIGTIDGLESLRAKPASWPYIYRWGTNNRHLSSRSDHDRHYLQIGQEPVQKGEFTINPRWLSDYTEMVNSYILREQIP